MQPKDKRSMFEDIQSFGSLHLLENVDSQAHHNTSTLIPLVDLVRSFFKLCPDGRRKLNAWIP